MERSPTLLLTGPHASSATTTAAAVPQRELAEPGLDDTEDGIEVTYPSGHVSGPWDPDELALLKERGAID